METVYPNATDIKLIVSDVDGSLLNSKGELSPQTAKTIRKVIEQYPSLKFVISTGRAERSIRFLREQLKLNQTTQHPISCINGCLIYSGDFKLLKEISIKGETVVNLIKFCENNFTEDISFGMYSGNDVYFFRDGYFYDLFHTFFNENVVLMDRETLFAKILSQEMPIHKLCVLYEDVTNIKNTIEAVMNPTDVRLFQTTPYCIDIMQKDGNKGTSLKNLLDIYHFNPKEVIVFGDGENDIPMFDVSGNSVAMGNAMDILKKHSNYVTKSNDEDGIAVFLEKVFLK